MKKNIKIFITGFFIIMIFSLILSFSNNNEKTIKHRMQWYLNSIFQNDEYTEFLGEKEITIAIIDSGVDLSNESLKNANITQYFVNNIDKEQNSDFFHGTFVCGIICSYPKNSDGVLGVNPSAHILSIDISDEVNEITSDQLAEAINFAVTQQVDIISISLVTTEDSTKVHEAINDAYSKGIIIVCAAGNDLSDERRYPASYDEVICVGSLSKLNNRLYGEYDNTVYVPGENIIGLNSDYLDNDYISKSGTSLSTPILSGVLSLILSKYQVDSIRLVKILRNSDMNITSIKDFIKYLEVNKVIYDSS